MMHRRMHTYAIRPSIGGPPVLTTIVDRRAGLLTIEITGAEAVTVDVTTARAMWMTIQEAVYEQRSLRPDGPTLTLEIDRGTGVRVARRRGL